MWDPVTGEQLKLSLTGHAEWVTSMSWSPSDDHILTTSADQTARIWDAVTGEELPIFTGHGDVGRPHAIMTTPRKARRPGR